VCLVSIKHCCFVLTPIVNKYLPLVPFAPLLIQPAFDPGFVFPVLALVLDMLALFAGADFDFHWSRIFRDSPCFIPIVAGRVERRHKGAIPSFYLHLGIFGFNTPFSWIKTMIGHKRGDLRNKTITLNCDRLALRVDCECHIVELDDYECCASGCGLRHAR